MSQTNETVGYSLTELAQVLGVARHRVAYAIEQYGVLPTKRFGAVRIWSPDQLAEIRAAVARTTKHAGEPAHALA